MAKLSDAEKERAADEKFFSRISVHYCEAESEGGKLRRVYSSIDRHQGQSGGRLGTPYWTLLVYSHGRRCGASSIGPFRTETMARDWMETNTIERADLRETK